MAIEIPNIFRPEELRNHIINGNFDIWQRGTSGNIVDSIYTADRWVPSHQGGAAVWGQSQDPNPLAPSHKFCFVTSVGTANPSPAATNHFTIRHHIEGHNFLPLKGKTFTLGFWVKSSVTGIYSVTFGNSALNRTLVKEYTISSANTWEYKTVTVTHDTTGTWDYSNGKGLSIIWALSLGSNFKTTPDTWQGVSALGSNNQVNFMATIGNAFRLAQVMLVTGSEVPDHYVPAGKDFAAELVLCQRYYEKSYDIDVVPGTQTDVGRFAFHAATAIPAMNNLSWFSIPFRVTKRAIPSVAPYAASAANQTPRFSDASGTTRVCSADQIGTNGWSWKHGDASSTQGIFLHWTADAEL